MVVLKVKKCKHYRSKLEILKFSATGNFCYTCTSANIVNGLKMVSQKALS